MHVHSFDTKIAKIVGVAAATILYNIEFWCEKNKANDKHFYENNYWTYNSVKSWSKLFDYLSVSQIRTAIEKLKNKGLIVEGNFNHVGYDKNKWYAATSLAVPHLSEIANGESVICQKSQIDLSEIANRFVRNRKPIPDINTDINTDSKLIAETEAIAAFELVWNAGMRKVGSKPKTFAKFKSLVKQRKTTPTEFAQFLIADIHTRIKAQVFGFDRLHPATYLNNDRWNDEVINERDQNPNRDFQDAKYEPLF